MKRFIMIFAVLMLLVLLSSGFACAGTIDMIDVSELYAYLTTTVVALLGGIGIMAFAVSLVVQVTKELPGICKLPTKAYVIFMSVVMCELSLFGYYTWSNITPIWYHVALTVFAALVVAYISIFGWSTLKELYERFKFKGEINHERQIK